MSYRVSTQVYTGPFDLLLTLVTRQKVAIGAISITQVADQYLAEIAAMGELDLEVASDFLLVAATLLDLKAASLVPQHEVAFAGNNAEDDDEDEFSNLSVEEAREVLIARLISYKQFRNAAAALLARGEAEGHMFARAAGPDPEFLDLMPDYLEGVSLSSLAVICADLDSRRESLLLEAEHVAPKRLPLALTIAAVDRFTQTKPHTSFSELLDAKTDVKSFVATFLAILELAKRGSVELFQEENFSDIEIERVEGAPAYTLNSSELAELGE